MGKFCFQRRNTTYEEEADEKFSSMRAQTPIHIIISYYTFWDNVRLWHSHIMMLCGGWKNSLLCGGLSLFIFEFRSFSFYMIESGINFVKIRKRACGLTPHLVTFLSLSHLESSIHSNNNTLRFDVNKLPRNCL